MPSPEIPVDRFFHIDVSGASTVKVAVKDDKVLHLVVVTSAGDEVYFVRDPADPPAKRPRVENSLGVAASAATVAPPERGGKGRKKVVLGAETITYDEEGSRP